MGLAVLHQLLILPTHGVTTVVGSLIKTSVETVRVVHMTTIVHFALGGVMVTITVTKGLKNKRVKKQKGNHLDKGRSPGKGGSSKK